MISVLIPVYNDDPELLVRALHQQISEVSGAEIIICNDGSEPHFSKKIAALAAGLNATLINFPENRGVIESRISLASHAKNDWLLFLDADLQLLREDFIQGYRNEVRHGYSVITGGISYQSEIPECKKRLHWRYGREREAIAEGFKTANFLIKKKLFLKIPFFQSSHYGHEDSWMGIYFSENNIPVKRIENAALHLGLEDNIRFLEKSITALRNIQLLAGAGNISALARHIRIFRVYLRVKKFGLAPLIIHLTGFMNPFFKRNLLSCNPSLRIFDLYRLGKLLRMLQYPNQQIIER